MISRFVFNFSSCVNVCLVSHLVSVYTCVSLLNHSLCVLACDVPSLFVGFVCFPTSIPLSSCVCLLNLPFCRLLLGFGIFGYQPLTLGLLFIYQPVSVCVLCVFVSVFAKPDRYRLYNLQNLGPKVMCSTMGVQHSSTGLVRTPSHPSC